MGARHTEMIYLYRDGSNYKRWGEVVFAGPCEDALRERLTKALESGEWFIARQVRVPELFFDDRVQSDDHCWHELSALQMTDAPVTDPLSRTIEDFVREVERASAAGWAAYDRSDT